jgi:predicted SprT family Zn-dependent metalloprotease
MTKQECLWLCESTHEEFLKIKQFQSFPKPHVTFNLDVDANKSFGQCRQHRLTRNAEIKIYKTHYEHGKLDDVINTIVHELCHAYDYKFSRHGQHWKYMARVAGQHFNTEITRCSGFDEEEREIRKQKALAILTCRDCEKEYLLFRKGQAFYRQGKGFNCGKCKGSLRFTNLTNETFRFELR